MKWYTRMELIDHVIRTPQKNELKRILRNMSEGAKMFVVNLIVYTLDGKEFKFKMGTEEEQPKPIYTILIEKLLNF